MGGDSTPHISVLTEFHCKYNWVLTTNSVLPQTGPNAGFILHVDGGHTSTQPQP